MNWSHRLVDLKILLRSKKYAAGQNRSLMVGLHSCKGSCARRPKVGKHLGMKLEYFIVIVIVKSFDHVCKLECMLGYKGNILQ